ncbi:geranylgeranyl reductase family protein [Corynebacterium sp. ES2794-CONJ1]|uniref:geranylgeranyl reductase family protein n=1 Tax=Corynebacterium sp. ES2794-CONJ1 TaxID=2980553 RepID=UPI0021DB6407|nr:geranylgeranyl reductase family protein [Corynebacterium sp. ES2794-CONJ1]MCU9519003.1 geranylgeranyl reductase family protein [Corynebacterium sp. ES2794-CONJ1]
MQEKRLATDILIIGAGPAGSSAALYAARAGYSTILVDALDFPRDKTCGDGLTPRAITQLKTLGLAEEILDRYHSKGLKLHGFGGDITAPWPDGSFGDQGSAMPRREFDHLLFTKAQTEEAVSTITGAAAKKVEFSSSRISQVELSNGTIISPRFVIVADGVRSTFGKLLGRTWHKDNVYGIAARSYCTTEYSHEQWIHSHLELTSPDGVTQPGYGWIFPLGNGYANVGCGALSTESRPAQINTKKLLSHYISSCEKEWGFGDPENIASALLPMGGSVSNVAGANWMLIGDAAALVNPLNGEGIDYGMESAEYAIGILDEAKDFTLMWPDLLDQHYGEAFLLARTAAKLLTYPRLLDYLGPIGLRRPLGPMLMPAAARLMGNLVTPEDQDLIARLWRSAGAAIKRYSAAPTLWSSTVPTR